MAEPLKIMGPFVVFFICDGRATSKMRAHFCVLNKFLMGLQSGVSMQFWAKPAASGKEIFGTEKIHGRAS